MKYLAGYFLAGALTAAWDSRRDWKNPGITSMCLMCNFCIVAFLWPLDVVLGLLPTTIQTLDRLRFGKRISG